MCRRETFNIEAQGLEAAVLTARRAGLVPIAVIPVDLFGQPADYDALQKMGRCSRPKDSRRRRPVLWWHHRRPRRR